MSPSSLVSLGYEGRTVEDLILDLQRERVAVLVDVRLTPLSRKPGMSKRRLASSLEAAGIAYVHLRALGNPRENRDPFRAGEPKSRVVIRRLLRKAEGRAALRHVAELMDGNVVALLCFERDHDRCHRQVVADEIFRARPMTTVVTL